MKKKVQKRQSCDKNKGMEKREFNRALKRIISRRHYELFEATTLACNYVGDRRFKEFRKLREDLKNKRFASKNTLKDIFDIAFEANKENLEFLHDGKSFYSSLNDEEVLIKEANAVKKAIEEIEIKTLKKFFNKNVNFVI